MKTGELLDVIPRLDLQQRVGVAQGREAMRDAVRGWPRHKCVMSNDVDDLVEVVATQRIAAQEANLCRRIVLVVQRRRRSQDARSVPALFIGTDR